MIAYGTDEYGNIINREAHKEPEQVGGGYTCNEKECFIVPPKCPDNKRLIVIKDEWKIIDIDPKHINDNGFIRAKNEIELMESGIKEIPKGYKIINKELQPKTFEEQLNTKEITKEIYIQIKLKECHSLRKQAYSNESDGLFFDFQRGEIDKQIWIDKVKEIKSKYPKP
jgi:hypothetical protein